MFECNLCPEGKPTRLKICPIFDRFSSYINTRCEYFTDGHVELSQTAGFSMKIRADGVNKSKSLRPEKSISIMIATKHSKSAQNDPELFYCLKKNLINAILKKGHYESLLLVDLTQKRWQFNGTEY